MDRDRSNLAGSRAVFSFSFTATSKKFAEWSTQHGLERGPPGILWALSLPNFRPRPSTVYWNAVDPNQRTEVISSVIEIIKAQVRLVLDPAEAPTGLLTLAGQHPVARLDWQIELALWLGHKDIAQALLLTLGESWRSEFTTHWRSMNSGGEPRPNNWAPPAQCAYLARKHGLDAESLLQL